MTSNGENRRSDGLHVALLSIHGLIRSRDLELGRDADTGGQTLYVVELARALGRRADVATVELFTRRIVDPAVSRDYAESIEEVSEKARIVRLDCGPEAYIRKEELWDHLDSFADNLVGYFREREMCPHVVHSHYADAGYVGLRVANHLGVPLVHTGHSLGRIKRSRLLASGLKVSEIEERYAISRRIEAEEETLAVAERVVVSTENEINEQYGRYTYYHPEQMSVIPPGTDLERFRPPDGSERESRIFAETSRFLEEPEKPMILAISRPDERKNIAMLVDAYGGSEELQAEANLVIVAGQRDDIREMESGPARVLLDVILAIDAHDLHGKVAYPKRHRLEDVPVLYRLAALTRGVFVNPALTEPFGLTLIEAAASGVPIVATEDGGPRDIIANCKNGYLIDPLDAEAMAETLLSVVRRRRKWDILSKAGLRGVAEHYSWDAHAERYVETIRPLVGAIEPAPKPRRPFKQKLYRDRALFTDLDQNLLGDPESLKALVELLRKHRNEAIFGIATGRTLESALRVMRKHEIPQPDVLITSVGTRIDYAPGMTEDTTWSKHIDHLWTPRALRTLLAEVPGLELQPKADLSYFKLSYYYDASKAPSAAEIGELLHRNDQTVRSFVSFEQYMDVIPIRASKGFALRRFAELWEIPLEQVLAAGGSGTDEDMLRGNTLAAVVANRHAELSQLTDVDHVYFAERPHAAGILEAVEYYDFYGDCRAPDPA